MKGLFVTQNFHFLTVDGAEQMVLHLGKPVRSRLGGYQCSYEILVGKRSLRTFRAYGEDSLHALLLALSIAPVELDLALRKVGGRRVGAEWKDIERFRIVRERISGAKKARSKREA
jgi:hypothetical protein